MIKNTLLEIIATWCEVNLTLALFLYETYPRRTAIMVVPSVIFLLLFFAVNIWREKE